MRGDVDDARAVIGSPALRGRWRIDPFDVGDALHGDSPQRFLVAKRDVVQVDPNDTRVAETVGTARGQPVRSQAFDRFIHRRVARIDLLPSEDAAVCGRRGRRRRSALAGTGKDRSTREKCKYCHPTIRSAHRNSPRCGRSRTSPVEAPVRRRPANGGTIYSAEICAGCPDRRRSVPSLRFPGQLP